jgi:hypothetical protein
MQVPDANSGAMFQSSTARHIHKSAASVSHWRLVSDMNNNKTYNIIIYYYYYYIFAVVCTRTSVVQTNQRNV